MIDLESNINYLKLLSKQYPNVDSVCTEIINLRSILSLPKGTEHFLTDLHGEYEAFTHVLRNASGVIKRKIDEAFGNSMSEADKKSFATLVYYPKRKMEIEKNTNDNIDEWYRSSIYNLIILSRVSAFKYTRSKVRKSLPDNFAYIIEELMHEKETLSSKQEYYNKIIDSIINVSMAEEFINALCKVIRKLVVDRLHIVGDIYDRGPGAHIILDELIKHHSVDIQWGNHDIIWMGAATGSEACIANSLRISLRYNNLETIEHGYGINLLPLATFALETYPKVSNKNFRPINSSLAKKDRDLIKKMHKAISIIQFKLEGQLIKRNPNFGMNNRLFLHTLDLENKTVLIDNKLYSINDVDFPTIDISNPYELTEDEKLVVEKLKLSYIKSDKLKRHTKFLYRKGSIYLTFNGNLLFHGGMPINDDMSFKKFTIAGKTYKGKELFDVFEDYSRKAFFNKTDLEEKQIGQDIMWYLWCGESSPLFAKSKMATFERYFINDKSSQDEHSNLFFNKRDDEELIDRILCEFNLNPDTANIITGHVPVKAVKGENPIKANNKLFVIDGGFSKAYHEKTGIAGYTLTYNSRGMTLVSHEPFESIQTAILDEKDILPTTVFTKKSRNRIFVSDTDIGSELRSSISNLRLLLDAYRNGLIREKKS